MALTRHGTSLYILYALVSILRLCLFLHPAQHNDNIRGTSLKGQRVQVSIISENGALRL